jgi:Flp pilus assembly protein TadG
MVKTIQPLLARRGSALTYVVMTVPVLVILSALSIDWGHVQMAKVELQRLCDSAARYAVTGASDGTALTKANYIASLNSVDGQTLTFAAADVEVGRWNVAAGTFTAGLTPINAVRVTGRRAVSTAIAGAFGASGKTVVTRAIAKFGSAGYGLIGLDSISFKGNATGSYWSVGSGDNTPHGNAATNGSIYVGGSSTLNGDAYYGPGGGVTGSGTVTGAKAPLASPLSFPNGSSGSYGQSNNDNGNIPNTLMQGLTYNNNNKNSILPGGNYYFKDFSLGGNATLTFTGPATIYCYGDFSMLGGTYTSGNLPRNLTVIMVPNPHNGDPPGTVTLGGNVALYANIYAPQSDVTVNGTGDIFGAVLGKTVDVSGTGSIYYDMALDADSGRIVLVK